MGGRGSGKTRAGAEWIADGIRNGTMNRVALIAATHHEARSIMIEGQSGLLSVSEGAQYEPSLRRITWPSGAIGHVLSADEPDSIRGHQFDGAWCDEFAKWSEPQNALDMILMALRLGEDPRMVVTTTPRNIAAMRDLMANEDVAAQRMSTRDNAANLAKSYLRQMERRYRGTRLGRQEIDGDLIEDAENALWQRDWIERHRLREGFRRKAAPAAKKLRELALGMAEGAREASEVELVRAGLAEVSDGGADRLVVGSG